MLNQIPSIAEAIRGFKSNYDFHGSENAEKTCTRAVDLLALYLLRGDEVNGGPESSRRC